MGIDKELLDILVCPKCKGDLELSEEEDSLICKTCSLKYPIKFNYLIYQSAQNSELTIL